MSGVRFVCLAALAVLAIPQSPTSSSATVADPDAYAVYSTHIRRAYAHCKQTLLIQETTGATYGVDEPGKCIHAPVAEQQRMQEVLADYAAHKNEDWKLEPRFTIEQPYHLLTKAETDEFTDFQMQRKKPSRAHAKLFRQTDDLIRLGRVFFNRDRTLAIALMSHWCGGLCGEEYWGVYEKREGVWVPLDWNQCSVMS